MTITNRERREQILAAWNQFKERLINIRRRQRIFLSDFDQKLTEAETEEIRKQINQS